MDINKFIEELDSRNLLHTVTAYVETDKPVVGYVGFDPTAKSLHVGHLAPIMMLVHLQRHGGKPIALVGGATAMIGDPSGKSKERNLLDTDTIQDNINGIIGQLGKFLRFDDSETSAEMLNNADWFRKFNFIDFIRDVGKHITVNYMMNKKSVQNRINPEDGQTDGMSFTEFTYQILQGYDFVHLNRTKDCTLQMGGSDQWGNITTGTELLHRMDGKKGLGITCPLLTKADGTKFGKSEGGNVWLDRELTSPFNFYQFWLNVSDDEAEKCIKIFTLLPIEEINELIMQHNEAKHLRLLQKALAKEITTMVHSHEDCEQAIEMADMLFREQSIDKFRTLSERSLLELFDGLPKLQVSKDDTDTVINMLFNSTIFPSKSEAKKMVMNNGILVNKQVVNLYSNNFELLHGKYIIVQKGKKHYNLVEII